ncbi:Tsp3A [Drosophila busckii]|uniref:Tetraspanin n=1 Tax=Drosophila busckii TaxID=30019 RepID=A0A0M5J1B1_DROBS|nr:tetraspanin-33 [Drosophila busckii]ALC49456.1 Tsp3A [Drosophila busckii]
MSNYRYGGGGGGGGYYGIEVRDMHMHQRMSYPHRFTFVSSCVKYMIFLLNFIFWLFGGLLLGIGVYAFMDKWEEANGWVRLETIYDVVLNISLVMIIAGIVIFVVSFAGCLGALRENTYLLKFYSMCLLIFFLMEMAIAIICFVFPQHMNSFLEDQFTDKIIHSYRDDPDLQNFIDFAQQEFKCCGLSNAGYQDWSKNEYFNCSSPSVEGCGVPYSCCINATDISSRLVNIMCGYGVQVHSVAAASKLIWTSGCIENVRVWAERNLYGIAGFALGIALVQLLVIYLAKTLEGQIDLQKSRWAT